MTDSLEILILDLLEWVSHRDRSYEETMDAWRTACPRFPVWEDANERDLVFVEYRGGASFVRVTPAGAELLKQTRPGISLSRAAG